jgi:hypothetical protein
VADLLTLQREIHQIAIDHGWWDDAENDNIPTKIALMHSELSEALEEYRSDRMDTYFEGPGFRTMDPMAKPEGFGVELADTIIRILDLASRLGLDMGALVELKMEYNRGRPHKHGGRRV